MAAAVLHLILPILALVDLAALSMVKFEQASQLPAAHSYPVCVDYPEIRLKCFVNKTLRWSVQWRQCTEKWSQPWYNNKGEDKKRNKQAHIFSAQACRDFCSVEDEYGN